MDEKISIELTRQEFDIIMTALSERPLKEVYGVFAKMLERYRNEQSDDVPHIKGVEQ